MGVHWKTQLVFFFWGGGGGVMKNQYREDFPKRGGAWTVCWFKGGLDKKKGIAVEGVVDNLMHAMI